MNKIVLVMLLAFSFLNLKATENSVSKDSVNVFVGNDSLNQAYLAALNKTEAAYLKIKEYNESIKEHKLVFEVHPKDVARLRNDIDDFFKQCDLLDSADLKLQVLEQLVTASTGYSNSLENLQKLTKKQLIEFEERKNEISRVKTYWVQVNALAKSDSAYLGVLDNSNELIVDFQSLENSSQGKINDLRHFETEIDSVVLRVAKEESFLYEYLAVSKKQYWQRNTPPIWDFTRTGGSLFEFKNQLFESYSNLFKTTIDAIRYSRLDLFELALILLLFYFLLIYLKKVYRIQSDIREDLLFKIVVKHPLVGAIFFGLVYFSLFNPIILKDSLRLFAYILSIPIFIYLNELLNKKHPKTVLLFWGYMLFYYGYEEMTLSPLIGRVFLFFLFVYSLFFLEQMKRSVATFSKNYSKVLGFILEYKIIRLIQVLYFISLILLSVGYFYLTNRVYFFASALVLNLTVLVMFLMLSNSIIKPLVVHVLSIPSIYIRNHQQGVIKTLKGWNIFIFSFFALYSYLIRMKLNNKFSEDLLYHWNKEYQIESLTISIGGILSFVFIIWFTFYIGKLLNEVLKDELFSRVKFKKGVSESVALISRYIITLYGIVIAMAVLGLDLDKMMLILGALGVGIGFGLQNIINDLVSGLVIIMEKPVLVGDIVKIGTLEGEVRNIGIRSSTIYTYEGSEVIVPNGNLVAKELVNLSLSDSVVRIEINVTVAFGTDTQLVLGILKSVAVKHAKVLQDPAPLPLFAGFGDSALKFDMLLWTDYLDSRRSIRSDIYLAIEAELKKANIEIPFPQRDIHIREATDSFKIENRGGVTE